MTDQEADEKFERLSEQIDLLPDEPPVVHIGPSKTMVTVSLVQLAFVVIALVGVVASINRIENSRIGQCVSGNQFRKDVAGVLFDASRNNPSPEAQEFFNRNISRFSLTDCTNPDASLIPLTPQNVSTKSTKSNP